MEAHSNTPQSSQTNIVSQINVYPANSKINYVIGRTAVHLVWNVRLWNVRLTSKRSHNYVSASVIFALGRYHYDEVF